MANFIGPVFYTFTGINKYKTRRKEKPDESKFKAITSTVASTAAQAAMFTLTGGLMMGVSLGKMGIGVGQAAYSAYRAGPNLGDYNATFGGNFQDTQVTATMRQRAIQAMQSSRMNTRSILGNEARSLHNNRAW